VNPPDGKGEWNIQAQDNKLGTLKQGNVRIGSSTTNGDSGTFDKVIKLLTVVLPFVAFLVLVYLVATGKLTADQVKSLLNSAPATKSN
jgi:hypothetical protein